MPGPQHVTNVIIGPRKSAGAGYSGLEHRTCPRKTRQGIGGVWKRTVIVTGFQLDW